MVCYLRAIRLRLSIAAERTITMERKEEKVDSTSVAFSPLETNSSTQTAYHQAAYPDQGCNQALPSTSFQSESHPVPLGPTDPAGSIIKRH